MFLEEKRRGKAYVYSQLQRSVRNIYSLRNVCDLLSLGRYYLTLLKVTVGLHHAGTAIASVPEQSRNVSWELSKNVSLRFLKSRCNISFVNMNLTFHLYCDLKILPVQHILFLKPIVRFVYIRSGNRGTAQNQHIPILAAFSVNF